MENWAIKYKIWLVGGGIIWAVVWSFLIVPKMPYSEMGQGSGTFTSYFITISNSVGHWLLDMLIFVAGMTAVYFLVNWIQMKDRFKQ